MRINILVIFSFLLFSNNPAFSQTDKLDYFPMHVDDEWRYFDYYFDSMTNETTYVSEYTQRITGDSLFENGQRYFVFTEGMPWKRFVRIDTTDMKVFQYDNSWNYENNEVDIFYLEPDTTTYWSDNGGLMHWMQLDTAEVNALGFNAPQIYDYIVYASYNKYTLTKGLGLTRYEDGDLGYYHYVILIYAKINGVIYDIPAGLDNSFEHKSYKFELYQNYPNPFNPQTTITYQVARRGRIMLSVFDMLGREVAVLVNEIKDPGYYLVHWNAGSAATGIYIYQLRAGDFTETRKMVLMR